MTVFSSIRNKLPRLVFWLVLASLAASPSVNSYAAVPAGWPEWDLIVIGADPEGISAAVAAAREGMKVLLVDHRDRVGGLYTVGELNTLDLNYKSRTSREIVNQGFFAEFWQAVGYGAGFDIPTAQRFFDEVLRESKVTVLLNHRFIKPVMEGNIITGIAAEGPEGTKILRAWRFVDATPDGDVAAAAGAPFTRGREELKIHPMYPAATLMFTLKGVNWSRVTEYLNGDANPYTGATPTAAWGYAQMFSYQPQDPNVRIRGLNIGRQKDGSVTINALYVFGVDPLDLLSKEEGMQKARAELPSIIEFMRQNCPGFENAYLAKTAQELYIRESRHIKGLKTLTVDDVLESRFYPDGIALGSYPVDLQSVKPGLTGISLSGTTPYNIPFGVLVPQGVDRLLVVGKAASFDPLAHGSARTVPVGMATGQAAGVAVKYSIMNSRPFATIAQDLKDIRAIQALLRKQGVDLTPLPQARPETNNWAYPYIQWLRNRALVSRFYEEDYGLLAPATKKSLTRLFTIVKNSGYFDSGLNLVVPGFSDTLSRSDLLVLSNQLLGTAYQNFDTMYQRGLLDELVWRKITEAGNFVTNAEMYGLLANVFRELDRRAGR